MSAQEIKLVLTDVDGTILPAGRHRVSERMMAAMRACIAAGIRVGAASGRDRSRLSTVFDNDPACCATMLATNGMEIYLDGRCILQKTLSREALLQVAELAPGFVCCEGPEPYVIAGSVGDLAAVLPEYAAAAHTAAAVPEVPIVKAFVFCGSDPRTSAALRAELTEAVPELGFTLPAPGVIGIVPRGWSKADGVDLLRRELGLSREQVLVCGDSDNDIEMLAAYPRSVAVAGASPEAKAAASATIGACEDDAVASLLEGLLV